MHDVCARPRSFRRTEDYRRRLVSPRVRVDHSAILKDAERTHRRLRRRLHVCRTTALCGARTCARVPTVERVGGVVTRASFKSQGRPLHGLDEPGAVAKDAAKDEDGEDEDDDLEHPAENREEEVVEDNHPLRQLEVLP